MFSDASAARSIQTNSMNLSRMHISELESKTSINIDFFYLVQKGQSAVLFGQITDFLDRSDTTAHRVNTFESDNFGRVLGVLSQFGF